MGVSLIGLAIIKSSVSIYYLTKITILFETIAKIEPKSTKNELFCHFLPIVIGKKMLKL